MKNIHSVTGYWIDEPAHKFNVLVSLDSWDGNEDEADQQIFYYTDGEPIYVGCVIAEDFVISSIEGAAA